MTDVFFLAVNDAIANSPGPCNVHLVIPLSQGPMLKFRVYQRQHVTHLTKEVKRHGKDSFSAAT